MHSIHPTARVIARILAAGQVPITEYNESLFEGLNATKVADAVHFLSRCIGDFPHTTITRKIATGLSLGLCRYWYSSARILSRWDATRTFRGCLRDLSDAIAHALRPPISPDAAIAKIRDGLRRCPGLRPCASFGIYLHPFGYESGISGSAHPLFALLPVETVTGQLPRRVHLDDAILGPLLASAEGISLTAATQFAEGVACAVADVLPADFVPVQFRSRAMLYRAGRLGIDSLWMAAGHQFWKRHILTIGDDWHILRDNFDPMWIEEPTNVSIKGDDA